MARLPYVDPTPAAEAKLQAQRAEFDRLWAEKRVAVHQRRLGEGEALAARAGSGRGCAKGKSADMRAGSSAAAQQATAFLAAALGATGADAQGAGGAEDGATRVQARAEHTTGSSGQGATAVQGGGDNSDDEPPRQRAMELQEGRQAKGAAWLGQKRR